MHCMCAVFVCLSVCAILCVRGVPACMCSGCVYMLYIWMYGLCLHVCVCVSYACVCTYCMYVHMCALNISMWVAKYIIHMSTELPQ